VGAGDEADLLSGAKAGDAGALAQLWTRHNAAVLRYLRVVVGHDDAEDVAAEAWIDAARNLRRFQGDDDAFGAWLFTIVRRRVIDHRRRQARRPDGAGNLVVDRTSSGPTSDELVQEAMATGRAARFIREALSPDQADAVVLRTLAGLTTSEVASVLAKREGAVRVLLHRGLKRLADRIPEGGV